MANENKVPENLKTLGDLWKRILFDIKDNLKVGVLIGLCGGGLLGGCASMALLSAKSGIKVFDVVTLALASSVGLFVWCMTWAIPLHTIYESWIKNKAGDPEFAAAGRVFAVVPFIFAYALLWWGAGTLIQIGLKAIK
jgi:hypothetical protein